MNLLETMSFRIHVVGDKTGETYTGEFKSLKRLSHRQELLRDKLYRDLLGGANPEHASERAKSQAELLSDCQACLMDTPQWWKESGNGLDLCDDNLLQEIWAETVKVRMDALNEIKKKGDEAGEKLKEMVEKDQVK